MPLEIDLPLDDKKLELEEYVSIIEANKYDFRNQDDVIDSAKYLKQLNNNKRLLLEQISSELHDIRSFQKGNYYGPRVFILLSHPNFYLRAVVWEPISNLERSIEGFNYDIYHDHNFDILTAGYFGPGYETITYTYEFDQVIGYLGEEVKLNGPESFTLSEGRLLLYRAKKDIHIQLPPKGLSISLNLIPKNESIKLPQYQFDEPSRTICRYLQNSGNELVVRMAGALGDPEMGGVLDEIFESAANVHVRALAACSLIRLFPDRAPEIHERVFRQGNKLFTDIFSKEAANAGVTLSVFKKQT